MKKQIHFRFSLNIQGRLQLKQSQHSRMMITIFIKKKKKKGHGSGKTLLDSAQPFNYN